MTTPTERRIALFLDFENLVTNTGISPAHFDLQPTLDRLLEKGKVVFRRAYCDWSRFREATHTLHELGVELIDVPPSTRAGKNGADMRLVIDALELCYAREHINTFVIASGDSDFCPLAYKLRENNRTVIGVAVKGSTSPFFVKACDEFLYLRPPDRKLPEPVREQESQAPDRVRRQRSRRGGSAGGSSGRAETPAASGGGGKVPELAVEVVARLLGQATGPLNPSAIKEAIVRKEPDFDEREHGFSTFSKLLAEMERAGLLRRVQHGRQWYVVPADMPSDPSSRAASNEHPDHDSGHDHGHDSVDGPELPESADLPEHVASPVAADEPPPPPPAAE